MKRKLVRNGLAIGTVMMLVLMAVVVFTPSTGATVTTGIDPDSAMTPPPGAPAGVAYEDFESGTDSQYGGGGAITTTIPGLEFVTTAGQDWWWGDWTTNMYNGKYPGRGIYTSQGNLWAWLGTSQGSGIIDFTKGDASYFSVCTSTYSGLTVDAYDDDGNYLTTSGWATGNTGTGKMTRLTISRATADMSYVVVHDTGNYWLIDRLWTDAPGIGHALEKSMSADSGDLGDEVEVKIVVTVPDGQKVTITDPLPTGFGYIKNSFTDNGVSKMPSVKKGVLTYTTSVKGEHILKFKIKVTHAKSFEDMAVTNTVTADWYVGTTEIDTLEDSTDFTINMFEDLDKRVGIAKADVVFAIDLTGSMGTEIDTVKTEAKAIMNSLATQIADVEFGLISYMDYVGWYSTTEAGSSPTTYSATYGSSASYCLDTPYRLDQDITDDITDMETDIGNLVLGCGSDGPQDYTRIIHESYNDPNLHWRTDATRFLILFGDNVPHDTNFDIFDNGNAYNRGGDPGRDTILGNGDDLNFETEVAAAAAAGVHIMAVYSGSTLTKAPWEYMADETDGGYYQLADADDIPDFIYDFVEEQAQASLTTTVFTETAWGTVFEVTNNFPCTITDVEITDRFGGNLEIDDAGTPSHGSVSFKIKGKTGKPQMTWEIGDLLAGETAILIVQVSTDVNPGGVQEYTSPGEKVLNSGATLKFKDCDGTQLSSVTDHIYITVEE